MKANAKIFQNQALNLDLYANLDCKVVVVGNPANTNARIICENLERLNKKNITALTRLDQNRSKGILSELYDIPVD